MERPQLVFWEVVTNLIINTLSFFSDPFFFHLQRIGLLSSNFVISAIRYPEDLLKDMDVIFQTLYGNIDNQSNFDVWTIFKAEYFFPM